jgi:alkylation response protein AidB-like acyl-CoA dehydrogenase
VDLAFTDEQDMLRDAVRGLCTDAADSVRSMEDDPKGYDDAFWQGLAAMGLTGLMTPEALGGSGMGLLDAVVIYEELGRSLVPSPHLASSVVAAGVLTAAGSDAQQERWLPRMAVGEVVLSVAWLEPDNSSGPCGVQLTARPDPGTQDDAGAGFVLTGVKRHVPYASSADRLVVLARTGDPGEGNAVDEGAVDLFLVDPTADGVTLTQQQTVAGDTQYRVDFDGVRVAADDRIGGASTGWSTWSTVMTDAMVLVAAQAVGAAEATHALTTQYAKERHQFDKPIGSFQAISHYLADGITAIAGARVLVHRAGWTRDEGRDVSTLAPMAKLFATQTCRDVTGVAIQVHGGMGFTVECDAQLYFRRAKSWQLNWFDDDHLEELIATAILD